MGRSKHRVPVDHGYWVRITTIRGGRPAGKRWFATARPRKRPPALVQFLEDMQHDPYLRVSSITPGTQTKLKEYDLG